MSLTSDAKKVYASSNRTRCDQTIKLFYCDAHDEMNESFAAYVRANTHDEAAKLLVDYWVSEGRIEGPDDIDEQSIDVYEVVPSAEGRIGVVEWHTIEFRSVPKDGLF